MRNYCNILEMIIITKIVHNFQAIDINYLHNIKGLLTELHEYKDIYYICEKHMNKSTSKLFKKESKRFMIEIQNQDFYKAWSLSFKDYSMKYIILTKDWKLLLDYLEKKYQFWKNVQEKILYPLLVFITSILVSKMLMSIFTFSLNYYLYGFILLILIIGLIFYFTTISLIYFTYRRYIKNYIYGLFLEKKCSLFDIWYNYNINVYQYKNTCQDLNQIYFKNQKYLQFRWKIISIIPIVLNIIIITLSIGFVIWIVVQVFFNMITTYNVMLF